MTHFSAYLGNANIDHDSKTGQRLLTTLSTGLLGSASGLASCLADYDATYAINTKVSFAFIVLCPEHAATIAKDFPDQRAARDFMRETAAMPRRGLARCQTEGAHHRQDRPMIPSATNSASRKLKKSPCPVKSSDSTASSR